MFITVDSPPVALLSLSVFLGRFCPAWPMYLPLALLPPLPAAVGRFNTLHLAICQDHMPLGCTQCKLHLQFQALITMITGYEHSSQLILPSTC